MIERLLNFLTGADAPGTEPSADELQVAVAALMVEAARMDESFDATEQAAIKRLLAERFDLAPGAVDRLVTEAQEKSQSSAQYFPFTYAITQRLSTEQRTDIIQMLWEVAYADGVLDPHEDALLRQIAGLIHVPDHDRGIARQRALARIAARAEKKKPD